MEQKEWDDLSERVAREMYCIDMADGMIPHEEAIRRWEAMPTRGSSARVTLTHHAGHALIALEKFGLSIVDTGKHV